MPTSVELTKNQAEAFTLAVLTLELILDARMVAILGADEHGFFVHFRPGTEKESAELLASVDWRTELRIVEEHVG